MLVGARASRPTIIFQIMPSVSVKNNLFLFPLALIAGYLIAWNNLSVLAVLAGLAFFWFILERFESALVLLVFYLPFQIALNLGAGFDLASGRVLILLFFLVWLLRSLKDKKLVIDFSLETLLFTLFFLLAAFSLLWPFEMDRAVRKILVFASVLISSSFPAILSSGRPFLRWPRSFW